MTVRQVDQLNVEDADIGLDCDPWDQRAAEKLIRNALDQTERMRRAFQPIKTVLPSAAEDDEDDVNEPDDVAVILAMDTETKSWASETA